MCALLGACGCEEYPRSHSNESNAHLIQRSKAATTYRRTPFTRITKNKSYRKPRASVRLTFAASKVRIVTNPNPRDLFVTCVWWEQHEGVPTERGA